MAQVHVDEVVQEAVVTEEPPTVREQVRRWLLAELLHGRVPLPRNRGWSHGCPLEWPWRCWRAKV